MSEWIKWEGGVCPVDTEAMIMTKLRNGWESHAPAMAGYHRWDHGRTPDSPLRANDIIAYRLVEVGAMSKIDWDGKLEVYHEDGRVVEITCVQPSGNEQWPLRGVADGGHIFMGALGVSRSSYGDMPGWNVRNVTEPKADIEAWAYSIVSDLDQAEREGMQSYARLWDAFARYVMTKEEAPVDPDLIAARQICEDHGIANPFGEEESIALAAIKRGRELERGEVK